MIVKKIEDIYKSFRLLEYIGSEFESAFIDRKVIGKYFVEFDDIDKLCRVLLVSKATHSNGLEIVSKEYVLDSQIDLSSYDDFDETSRDVFHTLWLNPVEIESLSEKLKLSVKELGEELSFYKNEISYLFSEGFNPLTSSADPSLIVDYQTHFGAPFSYGSTYDESVNPYNLNMTFKYNVANLIGVNNTDFDLNAVYNSAEGNTKTTYLRRYVKRKRKQKKDILCQ